MIFENLLCPGDTYAAPSDQSRRAPCKQNCPCRDYCFNEVRGSGCVCGHMLDSHDTGVPASPAVADAVQRVAEPGKRADAGKTRYDLVPPEALEQLARLYTIGAQKYAERNWEKGMSWSRVFACLMRHAWAYWRGETHDAETRLSHMTHVAWNAMALVEYERTHPEFDDRPKYATTYAKERA